MQNADGGFASYEFRRGPFFLEYLNPSEVFGEIMVDYSYTECSSAVTQILHAFRKFYPEYRRADIDRCIGRALEFIRSQQRVDGSWFGSWGVCFTYAHWFAMEGLKCAGETYANSERVRRGCDFLVQHQMEDGGWGESYLACTEKIYVQHEMSQVVNTAWACLALMAAEYPNVVVIKRGIQLLMQRQKPTGEWKQEAIEGVFNKTCMISYPNYKFIFPVWALGKFAQKYE
jgi:lanosterol synthase